MLVSAGLSPAERACLPPCLCRRRPRLPQTWSGLRLPCPRWGGHATCPSSALVETTVAALPWGSRRFLGVCLPQAAGSLSVPGGWTGSQEFSETEETEVLHRCAWAAISGLFSCWCVPVSPHDGGRDSLLRCSPHTWSAELNDPQGWVAVLIIANKCRRHLVLELLKLLLLSSVNWLIPSFVNGKGLGWIRCGPLVGGVRWRHCAGQAPHPLA